MTTNNEEPGEGEPGEGEPEPATVEVGEVEVTNPADNEKMAAIDAARAEKVEGANQ